MASQLDTELAKLRNEIIKITNLVENQVFESVGVLLSEPISKKKKVKKAENKIDKLDVKIEDICQSVFALHQPVAKDLRFVMSAMHMSSEMERIGDLAISIIKLSKSINAKHGLVSKFNISDLVRDVESITIKTNICFQTLNEDLIEQIFNLNKNIKNNAEAAFLGIIDEMKSNSKTVVSGTNLILVLKHIERMGDHCTNIAESVYFIINSKIVRHENFNEKK